MFYVFLAAILCMAAVLLPVFLYRRQGEDRALSPFAQRGIQVVLILLACLSLASTSYVVIEKDEVGHLDRVYLGDKLPSGRIIALAGQNGPQAQILGPGLQFRFLLNVLYSVEKQKVVNVTANKYAKLIAKDGSPLKPGQTFADPPSGNIDHILDATTFLENGGQKGPQVFVLTPGQYRLNKYLWTVVEDDDTDIEKGFVGVVKSNVHAAVNFGDLDAEKPTNCDPTQETDLSGGKLSVPLVPVGCIGIWDKALFPGRYYLNDDVYKVVLMDSRVQAWEFKGGFRRRTIALTVDQQGKITQQESFTDELVKEEYADRAVFLKVEGWDVPQELRVLVQITPQNAPIVVASVGGQKEVEHRIIVPIVRSITRDVTGGGFIEVEEMNDAGQIIRTKRPPKVMDLLNQRAVLEEKILKTMRPEGNKAGVEIKEIRFGDPAIPPELLVARLRQQLAEQLSESYKQERLAQNQRTETENARATADQQPKLVEAQIEFFRSKQLMEAMELMGRGEKMRLMAIAEGQQAQANILGQERVVELRKYELLLDKFSDLLSKHPELITAAIANAGKFVPHTMITTGGTNASFEGAAAIFGTLLRGTPEAVQILNK